MKKALNILKNAFALFMVIAAGAMMIFTVISVSTLSSNDRSIFGYQFYIVQSDSMSATDFAAGDIIFIKKIDDPSVLKEGDIISYISLHPSNYGDTVTHKIRKFTQSANGDPGFITYGTTTGTDDEVIVTYPYVLGKYTGRLPGVGRFFAFLKTTTGYILCILLPFLLLIGYNAISAFRLFRRYKREQEQEMKFEREKLEQERKQSEEMMKELLALKAQLAQNGVELPALQEKQADPTDIENIMKEFSAEANQV